MRNMAKRAISLLCVISMLLSMMITVQAAGVGIAVENQTLQQGSGVETVEVPIKISNNTGILGMTLQVAYDEGLTLTGVVKGDALTTLSFTEPGNFKKNPINIVWDGQDAHDTSVGTITILTFAVPKDKAKDYHIDITTKGVFDDNLDGVIVTTTNGKISVVGNEPVEPDEPITGTIITAPEKTVNQGTSTETIEVPISIAGNTGILGMTLQVEYGEELTLIKVEKGDALTSLAFTKPGDFKKNPVNIVWDGEGENDTSNGVIAILTFIVPNSTEKEYSITLTPKGVFDDNLDDVEIATRTGKIVVAEQINTQTHIVNYDALTKSAEVMVCESRTFSLIFADYENGKLKNIDVVEFGFKVGVNSVPQKLNSFVLGAGDKVMLWENMPALIPVCQALTIE